MKLLSFVARGSTILLIGSAAALLPLPAPGGSLMTMSNPVLDGSINTTAGNNNRGDWAGVPGYAVDPDEGAITDWQQIFIAHDSSNIYLRYLMNRTDAGGFLSYSQTMYLDTDRSRATGFYGGGAHLAIGAEYFLQARELYRWTGATQDQWSWSLVANLTYDDWPLNDHELTIPLSSLVVHSGWDLFVTTGGDDAPANALGGAGGDYYTYLIPEPASWSLLVLALGMWLRRSARPSSRP